VKIISLILATATTVPLLAQSVPVVDLPPAPSAVMQAQYPQYGPGVVAGSGFKFTAPATIAGPAGMRIEQPQDAPLALSLDDAIALGLDRNVRLVYDRANDRIVRGDLLQVFNALIPGLALQASSSTQEINLAAMGFKPSLFKIPGFTGTIPTIVKVDVTQAQVTLNQTLFSMPALELYRGAKEEKQVVALNTLSSRGELVQAVATAYLKVLADQADVTNAQALERAAKTLFDQGVAKRDAGVGTNLDALRGQVEFQNRVQQRVRSENELAKDIIQLNRIMGLPAGQQLTLTDPVPFAALADMDLDRARATAYQRRKDFLSLQAQIRVADRERRAVKYQRLPTLTASGYYGVLGETEGLYHGVFRAVGSLQFPIFREAAQRGEEDAAAAQLLALRQREADLRVAIDGQLRSALLDVNAAQELVKVARSNVELATEALADESDRLRAGVDDNLPYVDAEATLAGAQAQLVRALYQFNGAKLTLARNTGIIESQYRTYLGTSVASAAQVTGPTGY
jgi:outer membrane protein TolC